MTLINAVEYNESVEILLKFLNYCKKEIVSYIRFRTLCNDYIQFVSKNK